MRKKITSVGNSAALVLSQDLLGLMRASVGDEVDVDLVDRTLVVRPAKVKDLDEAVERATEDVLTRRGSLLERLAEGVQAGAQPEARRGRPPKYSPSARWFIARCYELGLPYDEFAPLAKRFLGVDVPKSTYDMQRGFLKHRTPEEMAEEKTVSLGKLSRQEGQ